MGVCVELTRCVLHCTQDFEEVALALHPNLNDLYHGTSPRDSVTRYTFTASELPNFFPIPQHLEMSFLPSMPKRLFFFCQREPESGGETPLCDYSAVWRDLPRDLQQKFRSKGVQYIRNYSAPKAWRLDPTQLKPWPDIYRTTDPAKVEEDSGKDGVKVAWGKNGSLRLTNNRPAFLTHPITGEEVWANHAQVPTQPLIHHSLVVTIYLSICLIYLSIAVLVCGVSGVPPCDGASGVRAHCVAHRFAALLVLGAGGVPPVPRQSAGAQRANATDEHAVRRRHPHLQQRNEHCMCPWRGGMAWDMT